MSEERSSVSGAEGEEALRVEGLRKRFGAVRALDGVTFGMRRGSVTGFIGANGAGKTTTMRIVATLESADEGRVTVRGADAAECPAEARRVIGWMPDNYGAYEDLTVGEYLDFFARAYGYRGAAARERVARVAEFAGLEPLLGRPADKLSKGMGQRLCLGRTLLHDPEVLLLDEPAAGLDPKARLEFKGLVRRLAGEGKAVLISSHILSELGEMCDTVVFIDRGRVVHEGAKEGLTRVGEGWFEARTLAGREGELRAALRAEGAEIGGEVAGGVRARFGEGRDEEAAALLGRLVRAGVPVTEFRRVERRLEEVFVDLVGGGGGKEAAR